MKNRTLLQTLGLFLGLVLFALTLCLFNPDPAKPALGQVAAIVVLMAVWWMSEAVPLAVTSLLPMILFPLLGIQNPETTASAYMNSVIFLYIGGFLIALAMERWNLHRRIALNLIYFIGRDPHKLIFGFMIATGLLSMWISNTATVVMMLPICLAIISKLETEFNPIQARRMSVALLLTIAYGSSIGGIATLVGTPTNLAFVKIYSTTFAQAAPFSFGQWFLMGFPISLTLLVLCSLIISHLIARPDASQTLNRAIIREELEAIGRITYEEKIVITFGSLTALLWIFRKSLNIGGFIVPGWSDLSPSFALIDDSTVSLFIALLLFIIPARNGQARAILEARAIKDLPWDAIFLFGGGFAIAGGFTSCGLTQYFAGQFNLLGPMPLILSILLAALAVSLVTEFVSNIATVQMFLPVLASWAIAQNIHPLYLMIPATLVSSMAFLLPVGTPPNAVIFGSGRIRVMDLIRYGWLIKVVSLIFIVLFILLYFSIFDIYQLYKM